MNLRQAVLMCSSLPLLDCVMGALLHLFTSHECSSSTTTVVEDEENDGGAANNRAAQKHFHQIQHIRGA
uniref:Secreted protein n=1 Tax=Manihot esculenta TaxID=3983 RepID=A0A2C9WBX2_MANES